MVRKKVSTYKSIVTITWKIEDEGNDIERSLSLARKQLDEILLPPKGLDGFAVQLDLAPMKTRKCLTHIKSFPADEIFAFVTDLEERKDFIINNICYSVRMNSDRYHVFRKNRHCAACGIEGKWMNLDLNPGDASPHFNLYAEEDGKLLLMTKDHQIPKSRGGEDVMENYTTCCAICNNLKGNHDITYIQIGELRKLYANPSKLPRRELRQLINTTRDSMVEYNKHL